MGLTMILEIGSLTSASTTPVALSLLVMKRRHREAISETACTVGVIMIAIGSAGVGRSEASCPSRVLWKWLIVFG